MIPDALQALPYIGDDPAELAVLEEGINTAGQDLSTYVTDLELVRTRTNAAWQAIEAAYADDKTAGLLDSGNRILASLKSAGQAVIIYIEEILQIRKSVDRLRDEWELARSQNGELESRPLFTPEDEATAKADTARLTEHFEDIQRRFGTLVTTMNTAAGYCARALNSAADPTTDPQALYTTASYGLDPPPREYFADKTLRHNTVRDAAVAAIALQIIAQGMPGDPSLVRAETNIPGGSNTPGSDEDGKADITWNDGTNIWIWEVKGPESSNPDRFIIQSRAASKEAAGYVPLLQASLPADPGDARYRLVQVGFRLIDPPSPTFTNWTGRTEDLPVSNSVFGDGGIVYDTLVRPEVSPPQDLPPDPPPDAGPDLLSLQVPIVIGREDPLEHLQDIASAVGNLGSATSDAARQFNQSLNDLSWRLMKDAFLPWDEAPYEGLWDGAGDVWNSGTDGIGRVWSAAGDLVSEVNPFGGN